MPDPTELPSEIARLAELNGSSYVRPAGLGAPRPWRASCAHNADVASSVEVQEFWKKHGELPGSAAGT
jgi:hypothetical protein